MSNIYTFLVLILLSSIAQAQLKQQPNYQQEYFCNELENLKKLLSFKNITSDNFVEHLDHNGPIAVSMLRKSLESYIAEDFFTPVKRKKLIKTVERSIFKWDAKEVSGDVYIFGEYHNHFNCLERQKDIIEIYNRGEISLGLEGVISSESSSLKKYQLTSFSNHLFGLENAESYSFATLIKFHYGLLKRFLNGGFDKNIIIAIARFSNQNSYLRNVFSQFVSKEKRFQLLWQKLKQLATSEIELAEIEDREVNLSITLYEEITEKLINSFNRESQEILTIDRINKVLANFIREPNIKKYEQAYEKLVLETIDLPRERSFVYKMQRHISFHVLKRPMVIIVGDDHVKRISDLIKSMYPKVNVHTTELLKHIDKKSTCLETLNIL